ncbi:MAG: hypothetical protein LQ340_002750 [Diploschistes diacapsis]|nr:MAG: hypothetical protein LQ340_002750 [Diploschistes diacapsis]
MGRLKNTKSVSRRAASAMTTISAAKFVKIAIVQYLQDLHDMLRAYEPSTIVRPSIQSLKRSRSWLGSLLGTSNKKPSTQIPANLPKGLYMFGDVGSGKTMLMDLFYDTLPSNIKSKTRIHFHNFMQDVHKRLHLMRVQHGSDLDAILYVAADIAEKASVLCFDEFQCTDVADAMILRRWRRLFETLLEALMSHGVVLVTTSNRHPTDLYKNGIQRESFVPCINLLQTRLRVINLDSDTDYRKIPRPPSGVYHHPLDAGAKSHAERWFSFLGDPKGDPPHAATHQVWGRNIMVPRASGKAAMFTFNELLGKATGAADYLELVKSYDAFVVTDVPSMTYRERDLARRFITFVDAVYESRAKLVLTTAVPLYELFLSPHEISAALETAHRSPASDDLPKNTSPQDHDHFPLDDVARQMMDDLDLNLTVMKSSGTFSGDEERFAFARALSRLSEMGTQEWVERGLGMEKRGGRLEAEGWGRVKSRWREDSA